jgi:hypothetical protein
MGLLSSIAAGLKALAALCGWGAQRDAEKNSPAMQANSAKKTEAVIDRKIADANTAAAQGDLTKERNLAAE